MVSFEAGVVWWSTTEYSLHAIHIIHTDPIMLHVSLSFGLVRDMVAAPGDNGGSVGVACLVVPPNYLYY